MQPTEEVILWINIRDVHQLFGHCLIPLDPWLCVTILISVMDPCEQKKMDKPRLRQWIYYDLDLIMYSSKVKLVPSKNNDPPIRFPPTGCKKWPINWRQFFSWHIIHVYCTSIHISINLFCVHMKINNRLFKYHQKNTLFGLNFC